MLLERNSRHCPSLLESGRCTLHAHGALKLCHYQGACNGSHAQGSGAAWKALSGWRAVRPPPNFRFVDTKRGDKLVHFHISDKSKTFLPKNLTPACLKRRYEVRQGLEHAVPAPGSNQTLPWPAISV